MAGLHQPDGGRITFGGDAVFDAAQRINLPAERRGCGVVFQSYAIWPHMNVHDNVAYPLRLRKVSRRDRAARVAEVLELVELDGLAMRYPHQLSGGQQQRVALARALVTRPEVVFADEPTGALDSTTGAEVLSLLRRSVDEWGQTVVMVTHDANAAAVADRVVLLADGRVAGEIVDPAVDTVLGAVRDLGRK